MWYGWIIIAVAAATNFFAMGCGFYSFGVVLPAIAADFPESGRFGASTIPMFMGAGMALSAPFIGHRIQTISLRKMITAGCLVAALGFGLSALAGEVWQLCLVFGLFVGVSAQLMGGVAAQALVVNWFHKNRPMALGISLLGISASGVVMPHIASYFGGHGSWRTVFQGFVVMLLVLAPLVWLLTRDRPEEKGLGVDGGPMGEVAVASVHGRLKLGTIYRDPVIWRVVMPVGIGFMGATALLQHSFAFAKDIGLTDSGAAWFISAMAMGAAAGKIAFTSLAQRVGSRMAFVASLIAQLAGFIGLLSSSLPSMQIASVVAVGLGFGGIVPLVAAILAELYGRENFAPVLGAIFPLFAVFQAGGTPLAGYIFDQSGRYTPAFWIFAVAIILGIALSFRIPTKLREAAA